MQYVMVLHFRVMPPHRLQHASSATGRSVPNFDMCVTQSFAQISLHVLLDHPEVQDSCLRHTSRLVGDSQYSFRLPVDTMAQYLANCYCYQNRVSCRRLANTTSSPTDGILWASKSVPRAARIQLANVMSEVGSRLHRGSWTLGVGKLTQVIDLPGLLDRWSIADTVKCGFEVERNAHCVN